MLRIFPRKTNATPLDDKVYFDGPPFEFVEDTEGVFVSCTFTWDKPRAEILADLWNRAGYRVQVGGPAYDDFASEFVPGRFVNKGHVFTSRGCNNKCWFCKVPRREGPIRELPIVDGWRVLDSNLLQCSESHIRSVFAMLKKQPIPVSFLGGLEAKILKDWHVELLRTLTLSRVYLAYDTADDYEPLREAAKRIFSGGFKSSSHVFSCYCLIGYPQDTFAAAEKRLLDILELGLTPFAMLYRDGHGQVNPDWITFQAHWANPTKVYGQKKQEPMTLFNLG